ncbi:MAG: hypothetical protein AAF358_13570 [Pseudomonadota bacterium]
MTDIGDYVGRAMAEHHRKPIVMGITRFIEQRYDPEPDGFRAQIRNELLLELAEELRKLTVAEERSEEAEASP